MKTQYSSIEEYNNSLSGDAKEVCLLLQEEINSNLSKAESKLWHGHPVWFLEGNPIVGYASLKNSVQLLFWSGQSFDEPGLAPEGTFKAAQARYTAVCEVNKDDLKNWLKKSESIQWDYKNIVKRRGQLERIK
jgi:hypothetical protein